MKKSIVSKKMMGLLVAVTLVLSMATFVSGSNTRMMKQQIYSHGTNVLGDWDVYPGDLIQDAVDNAAPSDTIYVHDDDGSPYTYHENVDVNKLGLTLIGDGMDTVTVKAEDAGDHTFHLTADGITMSGFTVTNSYLCGYGGIGMEGADNCEIHDNKCTENLCAGIFLKYSNNCEIKNNIVSNNNCGGIKLAENSNYNTVTGNTVENNKNWGMNVYGESNNNLIYNNYFAGDAAVNLVEDHNTNTWNIEKTPGENIVGGPYLGGNYYDIYEGSDSDGDGIGDTPYSILGGSNIDYLPLVIKVNEPPDAPTITGETNGAAGTSYEYGFTSIDPDGDDIAEYIVDWGDETGETIAGPFASGAEATSSHTWSEQGDYTIRAKAKDIHGAESDWGYLEVTMPVNQQSGNSQLLFHQILERLFGHFSLLEGIFYQHSASYLE